MLGDEWARQRYDEQLEQSLIDLEDDYTGDSFIGCIYVSYIFLLLLTQVFHLHYVVCLFYLPRSGTEVA